jgi:hypothetical protein
MYKCTGATWLDERDAVTMCRVDVVEDIKCGLHVTGHRLSRVE